MRNNRGIESSTDYIDSEELRIIEKLRKIDLELYGERKTASQRIKLFLKEAGKKTAFIASMPFYWLVVFKYVVGSFNPGFFVFVLVCSVILSKFGLNWGVLNAAMR